MCRVFCRAVADWTRIVDVLLVWSFCSVVQIPAVLVTSMTHHRSRREPMCHVFQKNCSWGKHNALKQSSNADRSTMIKTVELNVCWVWAVLLVFLYVEPGDCAAEKSALLVVDMQVCAQKEPCCHAYPSAVVQHAQSQCSLHSMPAAPQQHTQ
jgi:hypothetical protein